MENKHDSFNVKYKGTQGTMLVERDDTRAAAIDSPVASGPVNLDEPALVGLSEPVVDQRFRLKPGKTTVGRRADSDIVIPDSSVSSLHAWVIQDKGNYRVMNILSTNGTYVNDQHITEKVVQNGDRIRFGGVEMLLHTGLDTADVKGRATRGLWLGLAVALLVIVAIGGWFLLRG